MPVRVSDLELRRPKSPLSPNGSSGSDSQLGPDASKGRSRKLEASRRRGIEAVVLDERIAVGDPEFRVIVWLGSDKPGRWERAHDHRNSAGDFTLGRGLHARRVEHLVSRRIRRRIPTEHCQEAAISSQVGHRWDLTNARAQQ
jgi:hypothetical protein